MSKVTFVLFYLAVIYVASAQNISEVQDWVTTVLDKYREKVNEESPVGFAGKQLTDGINLGIINLKRATLDLVNCSLTGLSNIQQSSEITFKTTRYYLIITTHVSLTNVTASCFGTLKSSNMQHTSWVHATADPIETDLVLWHKSATGSIQPKIVKIKNAKVNVQPEKESYFRLLDFPLTGVAKFFAKEIVNAFNDKVVNIIEKIEL